jgi:hypothetical protein
MLKYTGVVTWKGEGVDRKRVTARDVTEPSLIFQMDFAREFKSLTLGTAQYNALIYIINMILSYQNFF